MSTGIYTAGGIVQFADSLYGTDDDPMDAVIFRRGVLHGLHHAADSYAQVRVNFMAIDAGVAVDQAEHGTIESSPTVGEWYRVSGSPFGEWPLTLKSDGTPYLLRYRIAGSVSDATGGPTATIRVLILPNVRISQPVIESAYDWIAEATFTTTTPTWDTTPATQGDAASATVITITAEQAQTWEREVSVYDAVSSATDRTRRQVLLSAHVFAKTDTAAKLPQLNALHISEYIGT